MCIEAEIARLQKERDEDIQRLERERDAAIERTEESCRRLALALQNLAEAIRSTTRKVT